MDSKLFTTEDFMTYSDPWMLAATLNLTYPCPVT